VENLIKETFEEMRRQGVDARCVARELQKGRFAPWTANPVEVHDRLMGWKRQNARIL